MAFNTIKIKKYSDIIKEIVAAGTITPGMLLERTTAGKVQAHSTAGGNVVPKMYALEDELQGNGIDTDYSANAPVQVWFPQPGDEIYGILADDNDVDIGDVLESNGDGTLREYSADSTGVYYPNQIVGSALEAVDTTGSPASTTSRIHFESC